MSTNNFFNTPILTVNEFQAKLSNDCRIDPIARVDKFDAIEFRTGNNFWTKDKNYAFQELIAPKLTYLSNKIKSEDQYFKVNLEPKIFIPEFPYSTKKTKDINEVLFTPYWLK